jgi:hypothetical protein
MNKRVWLADGVCKVLMVIGLGCFEVDPLSDRFLLAMDRFFPAMQ